MKKNLLNEHFPEITNEWDFEKNKGIDINTITYGSHKKPFWICPDCKSSYESSVSNRRFGSKCPYCSGRLVNDTNSLASLRPDIAKQWHPTLNGDVTPS